MSNVKILDCTLRDGGYVNGWDFGKKTILNIFNNLNLSGIEYIECGFLEDTVSCADKTLFNQISDLNCLNINYNDDLKAHITAMIILGKFSSDKIIPKSDNILLDTIRVTFKKNEIDEAFKLLYKIKENGYNVFANPTNIDAYSDKELLNLLEKINSLKPYGFSIVDTKGVLKEKDLLRLFYLVDNNLLGNIALCFHSHNNLQLSFSNAQLLMKICKNRELIIDSTVFGMGRGAGNLCSELLVQYINDNYDGNYSIMPILKTIDEQINSIFTKRPWGYSVPYYLAAVNHCHPNYASFIIEKQTVPIEFINQILNAIPDSKKNYYDIDLIKQIYLDKISVNYNDDLTINNIKKILENKSILIIASGKSIIENQHEILSFINKNHPYIISLNFIPENIQTDMIFISNLKRFMEIKDSIKNKPVITTSNIQCNLQNSLTINYSSYLNNSNLFDNAALMLLKLLIKLNIKSVSLAGLDGFSYISNKNYASSLNYLNLEDVCNYNKTMIEELEKISQSINLNFITDSKYKIP